MQFRILRGAIKGRRRRRGRSVEKGTETDRSNCEWTWSAASSSTFYLVLRTPKNSSHAARERDLRHARTHSRTPSRVELKQSKEALCPRSTRFFHGFFDPVQWPVSPSVSWICCTPIEGELNSNQSVLYILLSFVPFYRVSRVCCELNNDNADQYLQRDDHDDNNDDIRSCVYFMLLHNTAGVTTREDRFSKTNAYPT